MSINKFTHAIPPVSCIPEPDFSSSSDRESKMSIWMGVGVAASSSPILRRWVDRRAWANESPAMPAPMIATLSTGAAVVVFDAASEDEVVAVDVALADDVHVYRQVCLVRPQLLTGENAQDDSASRRNTSRRDNSSGVMARRWWPEENGCLSLYRRVENWCPL